MDYKNKIHKVGRISTIIILTQIVMVPLITSLYFGAFPPLKNLLNGLFQAGIIYIPISIAEFFTFAPILGSGGTYLAFMSGNLTNLKIPCATIAIKNVETEEEKNVIATISVAISAITTIIVITIGLILLIPLSPILNSEVLKPAFDNILPALFGSLAAFFFTKQYKLAIIPLTVSILIAFVIINILKLNFTSIQGALIPVLGAISAISSLYLYKKGFIKKEDI